MLAFTTELDWIYSFFLRTLQKSLDFTFILIHINCGGEKNKLLHHLNVLFSEKKIDAILPLTPSSSDLFSVRPGTVYCCVFNLCVLRPSLWLTPTASAQQFEAEGSWQTQKGFWDMQPYEFFIHSPPPTLASSLQLAVLSLLSLTSIVSCSRRASTPASPLNGG